MVEAFKPRQPEMPRGAEGELPEFKIFDLISSVGNGENKALELIVMGKSRMTYSARDLWREVMSHQAKDIGWRMNPRVPFKHCQDSLSPIGLVTKETLRSDYTAWGYAITEYGIKTGIPFAGLLLKWSYEHPAHSLYKMFGSTVSPSVKDEQTLEKKRAPETRYKIFWEIATNPNNRTRLTDIANVINEATQIIGDHLTSLSTNGILSYDVTEQGKPYSYFRVKEDIPEQKPKQYRSKKTLSAEVYGLLTQEYLSIEEIISLLIKKDRRYGDLDKQRMGQDVGQIASDLVDQGYLKRKKFAYDFRSQLTLSDEQREAIVSLITVIDRFRDGDREIIEEGRKFAQRVASDTHLFSELMLKAKVASPYANRSKREDLESYLITIIQEHPNSTKNQILQILEEQYGKRFMAAGLNGPLSHLLDEKEPKIESKKTKAGNIYRLPEAENQTFSSQTS